MNFDPNQATIYALIFLLGLLVGAFLLAGSGRKWKARYHAEIDRRREIEKARDERERDYAEREKEWRERDSLRAAAARDRRGRDSDGDGVPDDVDRRPADERKS